jgi:hypothetical protein
MSTLTQIIADAYRKMVNPPAPIPAARPKWVPASITEENVTAFVQAVTEAANSKKASFDFNGKKYGIKKEETNKEDDDKSKKIQDMDAEKAPKQASDEVPAEVKEEDSEEIKKDNVADKEKDAEEMQKIAASEAPGDKRAEMAEELVGNQHKLDVNKNGKIDGDDLKKLRGEEKEEDSEEEHSEPDADNMGGPSDHDADNKDEDDDVEEARDWTGHVPIDWTDHHTLRHDVKSKLHGVTYKAGTTYDDWRADHPTNPKHHAAAIARVKAGGGSYRGGDAGYVEDDVEKNGKEVNEVLTKKNTAADFIHDFVHSKNPEFAGKSVKQRQKMALGAYYAKRNESTNLTGEQTISSVAATYTAMVNENVAGDPHAHKLSAKANDLTALAHSSGSDTHHEDAQHAHNLAAEHYRVYAHHHHDPMVRGAANIHHEFHRSMANHHMLHLVSADQDREASDAAAKHYGKKSVEEGTAADASMVNEEDEYAGDNPVDKLHLDVPAFIRVLERAREDFKTDEDIHNFTQQLLAMKSDCIHTADLPSSPVKEGTAADAEAGPEVMDPVTQKAKDDADDETEVVDMLPTAAQDGADKLDSAEKPAAANSSAALPKVSIVSPSVTTNKNTENMNAKTIKSVGEAYVQMNEALKPHQSGENAVRAAHAASVVAKFHDTPAAHKVAADLHHIAKGEANTEEGEKEHEKMAAFHSSKSK